ncbi:unnamed protein product, partial [Musa textilis]
PRSGRGRGNPAGHPPPPPRTHRCSTDLSKSNLYLGKRNASLRRRGERSR